MSAVEEHYKALLAPIYSWMSGGLEAAFQTGGADLEGLLPTGSLAVDLGAGFGMHAIPLARLGWRVVAIDSSSSLLGELEAEARGLPVTVHRADLLDFEDHLQRADLPNLVLCMGDTLTHLPSTQAVIDLIAKIGRRLPPGGRFVATFRDYSSLPVGDKRFILVRSDARRILTCILEGGDDTVLVHDMLHERTNEAWEMKISSYRKLKLQPQVVVDACNAAGLRASVESGPRGMLRLVADA